MKPTAFGGLVMNAAEFAIYSEVVRPLLLLLLHGGAYRLVALANAQQWLLPEAVGLASCINSTKRY